MEALYVCLFSNGHIKVGRSATPTTRIEQHKDRVACLGVTLDESYVTECPDNEAGRESALINRCAQAAMVRHQVEWFYGLSFDEVCRWAFEAAHGDTPHAPSKTRWSELIASLKFKGMTQSAIANHCGCDQSTISDLYSGRAKEPLYSLGEKLIVLAAKAA